MQSIGIKNESPTDGTVGARWDGQVGCLRWFIPSAGYIGLLCALSLDLGECTFSTGNCNGCILSKRVAYLVIFSHDKASV